MSDHLAYNSTILNRNVRHTTTDDGLSEAFVMMRETNCLLEKINALERSLAKERKLKAGFKVMYDSIDSENKLLKSIISRKFRKQQRANESGQAQAAKNPALEEERSSTPRTFDGRCPTPTQSASTQTSPWLSLNVTKETPHPFSERFRHTLCTSLKTPLMPFERDDDDNADDPNLREERRFTSVKDEFELSPGVRHDDRRAGRMAGDSYYSPAMPPWSDRPGLQELLDRVDDLTEKLQESREKLKEAEEKSEMMAIQMETYKSDFMSERSDRENAMGRIIELERELSSLKRMLEDQKHHRHHRHALSCCLGNRESFQIQSYESGQQGTFVDDVLIARGTCQETERPEPAVLEFDWGPPDDGPGTARGPSERKSGAKGLQSSSSESLDLLPTEHGGDDYYA